MFCFSNTKDRKRGVYEKKRYLCVDDDFDGAACVGSLCFISGISSSGVSKRCFRMKRILYIKIDRSNLVADSCVKFEDIVQMECTDQSVINRLKTEKLLEIEKSPDSKNVVSIFSI